MENLGHIIYGWPNFGKGCSKGEAFHSFTKNRKYIEPYKDISVYGIKQNFNLRRTVIPNMYVSTYIKSRWYILCKT